MPRPPTFDKQDVLDQAMYVFWRQGYHATSIRDLVRATGLQPGSLYAAFGGKRRFFQRVLDHYHQYNIDHIHEILSSDSSPLERIRLVFLRLLGRCRAYTDCRGCLMSNTILELSCLDAELSQRANHMFEEIEQSLLPVIEEGQQRGEIVDNKRASLLAKYLVLNIHGIRVYSRGRAGPPYLQQLVEEILGAVTAPAH